MAKREGTFKTNLRALILKKSAKEGRRITQDEVAEKIDVKRSTVSRWVNGQLHEIDYDTLHKFANYFGCKDSEILRFSRNEGEK